MSNLIMPSPFICLGKYAHTFFSKKMMDLSKAIGGFESPLPCNRKFECSVHIFRGPWFGIGKWHSGYEEAKYNYLIPHKHKSGFENILKITFMSMT